MIRFDVYGFYWLHTDRIDSLHARRRIESRRLSAEQSLLLSKGPRTRHTRAQCTACLLFAGAHQPSPHQRDGQCKTRNQCTSVNEETRQNLNASTTSPPFLLSPFLSTRNSSPPLPPTFTKMPSASEILYQFLMKEFRLSVISFVFLLCYGSPVLRAYRFAMRDTERALYGVFFHALPHLVHWSLEGKFHLSLTLLVASLIKEWLMTSRDPAVLLQLCVRFFSVSLDTTAASILTAVVLRTFPGAVHQ